jgi:hypothetical protein
MSTVTTIGLDTPLVPNHPGMRAFGRDPFAEGIIASGHAYRSNRLNTWPHRQPCRNVQQIPCQRGAVHRWHKAEIRRTSVLRV